MSATVYVFADADGAPLYAGVTTNGVARLRSHRQTKDWWPQVASARFEHFDALRDAYAREGELITTLQPRCNRAPAVRVDTPPPVRTTAGDKIRYQRRRASMTQAELAEAVGVTPRAVQQWEAGVCSAWRRLPAIAQALRCRIELLRAEAV